MTIDYKIDENDFLTHQLFIASKSGRIKRKRLRNKIVVPLFYVVFGIFYFFQDNIFLAAIFFILGFLWFLIYPLWERRRYIRHYKGFIKENYKDRFGKTVTLEFNNDFIKAKDNGSESKILTTELEEIYEIPTMVLIRLKGGHSLILPKDKIESFDNVQIRLKELSMYLKIKYEADENWKWE